MSVSFSLQLAQHMNVFQFFTLHNQRTLHARLQDTSHILIQNLYSHSPLFRSVILWLLAIHIACVEKAIHYWYVAEKWVYNGSSYRGEGGGCTWSFSRTIKLSQVFCILRFLTLADDKNSYTWKLQSHMHKCAEFIVKTDVMDTKVLIWNFNQLCNMNW